MRDERLEAIREHIKAYRADGVYAVGTAQVLAADADYLLDRIEAQREVVEAARWFVNDEGGYGNSPAQNIENLAEDHGSLMTRKAVQQGFYRLREALDQLEEQTDD